jgi:hypothetical protein
VSGLVDASVVVEGRSHNGALQTARLGSCPGLSRIGGTWSVEPADLPLLSDLIRDGAEPLCRLEEDVLGWRPLPNTWRKGAAESGVQLPVDSAMCACLPSDS